MTKIPVRVTRTYDVPVTAEYGDDDAALIAKAKIVLDDGDPSNDPPVVVESYTVIDGRFDSKFDTLDEYNAAPETITAKKAEDQE